jgi:hypothetical protein
LEKFDDMDFDDDSPGERAIDALEALLKSKLVLDKGQHVAGVEIDSILCAEVLDEDRPWDADEIDW